MKAVTLLFLSAVAAMPFLMAAENTYQTEIPSESSIMSVKELCENISELEGEEIFVRGSVDHVCRHDGRKMNICQEDSYRVHVKACDEMESFDPEIVGSIVTVRGIVRGFVIDREYLLEWEKNLQDEEEHHHDEVERIERYRVYLDSTGLEEMSEYWVEALFISE
ncbi:hypothetical protein JW890_00435 [candidate division WOR-3 bacterium]|nr:hypothetical protein [candidate division WOR-3 bacterium]